MTKEMDFSIIIPSRNRPQLLKRAIESLLIQTHPSMEVIVVNDGSEGENESAYHSLAGNWPEKVRFIHLEKTPRGHGPSFAINRGAENARGTYIGFLDDDDYWTDPEHLARAAASLKYSSPQADLYFSNQLAYQGDERVSGNHWLAGMEDYVTTHSSPNPLGVFNISVEELMKICGGKFAHLNTMITSRKLYNETGGMDEQIRYECEWDLYLRLLGRAQLIQYAPVVVSRHNVPDANFAVNESTAIPLLQKLFSRGIVLDKALAFSPLREIREKAAQHKIYTLKRIAELLANQEKYSQALFYAREARIRALDLKWRLYTWYLFSRTILSSNT